MIQSISTKVWDWAVIHLATPGSAVRLASIIIIQSINTIIYIITAHAPISTHWVLFMLLILDELLVFSQLVVQFENRYGFLWMKSSVDTDQLASSGAS